MALSYWFLISACGWLPLMLAADESCSPKVCGGVTIADPFWKTDWRATRACGSLDFQVNCTPGVPRIPYLRTSVGFSLRIVSISYENHTLLVVDTHREREFDDPDTCHRPKVNSSSKPSLPFSVSSTNLGLVFYNCTLQAATAEAAKRLNPEMVPIKCDNESNLFVRLGGNYSDSSGEGDYALPGCVSAIVPVFDDSGNATASDYRKLIRDGFLLTWPPPMEGPAGNKSHRKIVLLIVLLSAAAVMLIIPCIYVLIWRRKGERILLFLLCKKSSSSTERNYKAMIESYGSLAPTRYTYSELMKITSFHSNQLGKGGYGVVYSGRLQDGRLVAVKFLHDCKGNGEEFVNEVMSIGRTSHVNIVSLFGFCLEGSRRALIYECMSNGSLDQYIYSENPKEMLGWEKLYSIAIGIARGLEYLHHGCNTRIIHFDIKPQNILLDEDFCPKIADFGLAKLCRSKESKVSMVAGARGTIGFIAPEVHSRTFGVISTKSDVYSYGMMLLEMVGGRKNVRSVAEKSSEKYFPDWIYEHFGEDDGFEVACEVTNESVEAARKMSLIGLWCIQVLPTYRPTMAKVVEMFERSLDELDMPPKQSFCQLLENSDHNMSVESGSSTNHGN